MKQWLTVLAVLSAAVVAGAQQRGRVFPFSYEEVALPNGFRAYLVKAATPGQIAYVTYARVGSRDEVDAGRSGFAHFFEHMMFAGTKKYPDFDRETTKMGAFRNASTGSDVTQYYFVANTEYLDKIIDIESDRFQGLAYEEPRFKTEAGAVLGEHQQGALDPQRWLNERVRSAIFSRHPYGHPGIGTEADVRAMPTGYSYSQAFFRRFYRPENTVLVVAGDFDTARAKSLIARHYGGWQRGYAPPAIPVEPPQTAPREVTVGYPGRTLPILTINYRAPAWSPTDRIGVALTVLGEVAFGPNSTLYRKLVLRERRVQTLGPSFGLSRDPYIVSVQATVANPAETKAIEGELLAGVKSFQETLPDAALLASIKSNLRYRFVMSLETAQDIAFAVRTPIVSTGRLEPIEDYYATLESITAADVREAARRYLVDSGRTIVTMVQEGN
jgi:zinc protease